MTICQSMRTIGPSASIPTLASFRSPWMSVAGSASSARDQWHGIVATSTRSGRGRAGVAVDQRVPARKQSLADGVAGRVRAVRATTGRSGVSRSRRGHHGPSPRACQRPPRVRMELPRGHRGRDPAARREIGASQSNRTPVRSGMRIPNRRRRRAGAEVRRPDRRRERGPCAREPGLAQDRPVVGRPGDPVAGQRVALEDETVAAASPQLGQRAPDQPSFGNGCSAVPARPCRRSTRRGARSRPRVTPRRGSGRPSPGSSG